MGGVLEYRRLALHVDRLGRRNGLGKVEVEVVVHHRGDRVGVPNVKVVHPHEVSGRDLIVQLGRGETSEESQES